MAPICEKYLKINIYVPTHKKRKSLLREEEEMQQQKKTKQFFSRIQQVYANIYWELNLLI